MTSTHPQEIASAGPHDRLRVDDVVVDLGNQRVLDRATLELAAGELGCLLGSSGCGKTTLLRAIAGLQPISAGRIAVGGRTLSESGRTLAPDRRGIGLVFQDLALFPHLDVAGNIGFGLLRLPRAERQRRIGDLIERLRLGDLAERYPHELSGGQQQRVAIARALAPEPAVLLLDEPFSSLDAGLRKQLRGELRELLKQLGRTAILVTHDQEEAMAFADRVAVMRHGRIEQFDTPWQLYHRPATRYVAGFVGDGVLLPARREGGDWRCALGVMATAVVNDPDQVANSPATSGLLLCRPDDILPSPDGRLRAQVEQIEFRGAENYLTLRLPGGELVFALWPSHAVAAIGTEVGIRWQAPHTVLFADQ